MEYTMEERCALICEACLTETSVDIIDIFEHIADCDFVRIHGPEHHILDGAAFLAAYRNAGGKVDLAECLQEMTRRGLQMPGAACGLWGVCGAVTSLGAAMSILDGTGPLTSDGTWGKHMEYTSAALQKIGHINGPRCCKRDGYIALLQAADFASTYYGVPMAAKTPRCHYSAQNAQCIGSHCPFSEVSYG
jgi:hypothetical protein